MSIKKSSDVLSKRMAELLKAGAIMLNDYCPDCHVPLFKLRDGQIICPSCNKRAFYVKEGEEYVVETMITLENLRKTITSKLSQLNISISMEQDTNQLYEETKLLLALLEALERLEKLSSKKS
ncbi:MAG: Sjogren's syndrome/scleroderma autoantigen 1 family protein [Thermoprotei archaeon]